MPTLFDPVRFGDLELANRIVMAPLTRNRAGNGLAPTPLTVEYYTQRAEAGLIITEASQVDPLGQGYLDTPGIHSDAQVAAWKQVTEAVHAKGGKIVIQLWHVGRISHSSLLPGEQAPLAPSAVRANTKTFTKYGFEAVSEPRALTLEEIPAIVEQYRVAARKAIDAGFDGVEVHGANGYLIDQFLRSGTNLRDDAYGGTVENRTRFLVEVLHAVTGEIGHGKVGLRLSPGAPVNDAQEHDPQGLFNHVAEQVAKFKLAYLHIIEGMTGGERELKLGDGSVFDYEAMRERAATPWMVNNGYDRAMALDAVASGRADAVAFGRPFIANPDLVRRLREDAPLNGVDRDTLYGGGAKGYTDYPTLEEKAATA
jgi:N-ethylmaleimide reductase